MSEVVLPALTKIGSILGDESTMVIIANLSKKVTNLTKLPGQVEQIGKQLEKMGIAIGKISTVHLADGITKSWIGEVRKLACRVEDVMDKFSYHVAKLKGGGLLKKFAMKRACYDKVFTEIMDEVAEVDKEIQLVIQMRDQWLKPCKDSFPVFIQDEGFVGIEDNRILLTRWLYSKEPESTVITVSGMGGLGKSTLVSNVYEREKISFSVHAWIAVSQIYNVDALFRKLLWKIGYTEQPSSLGIDKMDVNALKKEIQKRFENRKYLIVIDDVWEKEIYMQMHDAFENLQGSRIIITTRKDDVAKISSPTRHLELRPLNKPDAFDLFCRRAFCNHKGHMCPKNHEMIATAIVDRCRGMPQAIVTIGSMLSFRQELDIWQQTYYQLLKLSTDDHVRDIINLCYHDLSGDVRNCLVYCSLFPGDHPMSRDSLVRLWVAEGFVPSKGNNAPEVVVEGILMELIHRNMLEVVEIDELGRVTTCKMHDIVRELAFSFAEEERYASANDYGTMIQIDRDVRRLSLCGWKDSSALKLKFPRLRTVVSLGLISSSPDMLSSILSVSNYLTVLELQDSEITEVPATIGSLFNLRYIGLRRTKVKSLPDSIENLSNLQTLDIKQTKIEKLPRGLVRIRKLRHLIADRYADEKQSEFRYFVGMQAPKELSNLEELQTLETVESSNDLAEQLKKLMQLRSVWIDNISAAHCANLFATLSTMPFLSSLLLSARDENEALSFKALNPRSTALHRLIIRGQWAKGTLNCPIFLSHGKNLKYLALSWCHLAEDPLGMLAPHMPNLAYLRLNNMHSPSTLVLYEGSFPNLKTLVLKHMHDVRQLNIIDGALPSIEGLYVVSLLNLDKIPQGIESLHSLKKLWLVGLHKDFRSQWLSSGMHQKIQHVLEVRV
ncbi:disease resistance protein RPM1-like isoform X2 [Lolium rigidum]|nr:disease resistance protein RPM1-like isoform X2 [Lolium rigidum]